MCVYVYTYQPTFPSPIIYIYICESKWIKSNRMYIEKGKNRRKIDKQTTKHIFLLFYLFLVYIYIYIYIYIYMSKLTDCSQSKPKAPFSIATTRRCRGGHYPFLWIAPFTLDMHPIMLCWARRHQVPFFDSLVWLNLGLKPPVSWTIGENSTTVSIYICGYVCVCGCVCVCVCVCVCKYVVHIYTSSSLSDMVNLIWQTWIVYSVFSIGE